MNLNHNLDQNSIGGAIISLTAYILTFIDLTDATKLGLAFISAGVGVSTIWYNIKKIKKLDK
jgi:hypothetical protein